METLHPSFDPPSNWRTPEQRAWLKSAEYKRLRQSVLLRDNCTCRFCGYRGEKWMYMDHVDGDPENNALTNLQTLCSWCNVVKHAGMGCVILGLVDLYQ